MESASVTNLRCVADRSGSDAHRRTGQFGQLLLNCNNTCCIKIFGRCPDMRLTAVLDRG